MIENVAGTARLPAGKAAPRARMPGLDGLRGLAVAGVVAYHLGAPGLGGGYLGVDLFFVLSGFLITGLLLERRDGRGRLGLAAFWGRRARRLLPALLVVLLVLSAAAAVSALSGVTDRGAFRDDVLATLGYVANWHQLVAGQSYFAQFAAPSPLAHAWSLGIEEQFYVVWPLALAALLWGAGRRAGTAGTGRRRPVLLVVTAAALASAAWMAWLAAHGASADRLYYGTDTRAFDLLAGAALAIALWGRPEPSPGRRRLRASAGAAGFAGLAAVWAWAGRAAGPTPSRWIFEGGMALAAVAALAVVTDAAGSRPGPLGRLLSVAPLRFLGRVSYALYLWHWPVITQLTAERTGLHGAALAGARLGVMGTAAVASTLLLEEPVRRWRRTASGTPHRVLAPAAFAGAAAVAVLAALPVTASAAAAGPAPALSTSVAGAGGLSHEEPLQASGLAGASPLHPLRVTLVGDSVMRAQAPAVTAALESTGAVTVTDTSYPGWGLANDPSWPSGVPAMLQRTRAQVVVATWSWDDDWALSDQAGYRAVLARFLATVLDPQGAAGAQAVVLEQFPPLGPLAQASGGPAGQARRVAGVSAWNAAAASMPARFPGRVLYLPLAAAVEAGGRYTSWLAAGPAGRWVRVRSVDATHFCPAGAARYAVALLVDLRTELPLPAAGGWWSASWSRDPVYDTPPGSCPATGHPA